MTRVVGLAGDEVGGPTARVMVETVTTPEALSMGQMAAVREAAAAAYANVFGSEPPLVIVYIEEDE